jgi:HEAT repeat protein
MNKNSWSQYYFGLLFLSVFLFLCLDKSVAAFLEASPKISSGLFDPYNLTIAQTCTSKEVKQYISAFRDPWQRDNVVRDLVACGQTAIPALTRVMQTEKDAGIRQPAAAALGYIGGTDARKPLIDTLREDSSATVRKTAADALGTIGDPTTIPLLIDTLGNSNEDMGVRQSAATSLGDIGGPIAIDTLITMLQNTNESLKLRQSAVKALQTIKDPAINSLVTALGSKDLQTQYWAVTALSEISSERSINTLETNKARVTEILEAAYKANIVEFDRAPAASTRKGVEQQLSRRPLLCKIPWVAEKWAKCQ